MLTGLMLGAYALDVQGGSKNALLENHDALDIDNEQKTIAIDPYSYLFSMSVFANDNKRDTYIPQAQHISGFRGRTRQAYFKPNGWLEDKFRQGVQSVANETVGGFTSVEVEDTIATQMPSLNKPLGCWQTIQNSCRRRDAAVKPRLQIRVLTRRPLTTHQYRHTGRWCRVPKSFRVTLIYDVLLRGSADMPIGLYHLHLARAEQLCRLHYSPGSMKAIKVRLRTLADYRYVQFDALPTKLSRSPYYYTLDTEEQRYFRQRIREYIGLIQYTLYKDLFGVATFTTFAGEACLNQMRKWTRVELADASELASVGMLFSFANLRQPLSGGQVWEPVWNSPYTTQQPTALLTI